MIQTLTARWIFPVDGPPLERGTIAIDGERIVAVEPQGTRTADVDLGNVAILPGLVNAHTHLDLSGMRGKCPPTSEFTNWLRAVIRHRRGQTSAQVMEDIRAGLAESLKCGTTLLGDIAVQGLSWTVLSQSSIRAIVFFEVIGLTRERAYDADQAWISWRESHAGVLNCRPGVSPHAPYSVRMSLFSACGRSANYHQLPIAVHLAETTDELDLLQAHQGPLVAFLQELGALDFDGLTPNVDAVIALCDPFARTPLLLAHANYWEPPSEPSPYHNVIYCPRTHAAFGHPPHPFREFLARGVRVALGTDSLASNPELDVLAEARFVHEKYPDVPGAIVLRMATLSGAEALGWADETGSLTPGKSADLVVLPLANRESADPHSLILESNLPVSSVMFRGQWTRQA
ncbi:MAG: amidohydrolase family protein [Gemmataceae bacterium]|nr:amidohydrolase family protein [Gemmataceae bacterium]